MPVGEERGRHRRRRAGLPACGVSRQTRQIGDDRRYGQVLGEGLPYLTPVRLLNWFREKGGVALAGVTYEKITDQGLVVVTADGERKTLEADSIIVALPLERDAGIVGLFEGRAPEVYQIGDSREFGYMHGAFADGADVGRIDLRAQSTQMRERSPLVRRICPYKEAGRCLECPAYIM